MRDQAPEPPPDGRSQRDRMLAGELYIADDPQLAADNLRALTLTREFNASDPADGQARLALLAELLGSVGEGTEIRPPLYCDYGYQTHIGARVLHQLRGRPAGRGHHAIGDDVQVGPNVQFLTPTHPVKAEARRPCSPANQCGSALGRRVPLRGGRNARPVSPGPSGPTRGQGGAPAAASSCLDLPDRRRRRRGGTTLTLASVGAGW
jgi:hypothetical protein